MRGVVFALMLASTGLGAGAVFAQPAEAPGLPPQASAADMDADVGVYQLGPRSILHVGRDGDHLTLMATSQPTIAIRPSGEARSFGSPLIPNATVVFDAPSGGHAPGLVLNQNGYHRQAPRITDAEAARIEALPPVTHTAVAPQTALYDHYVGRYLMPNGLVFDITRDGDRLLVQVTGQPQVALTPEGPRDFFLDMADIQVTFTGPEGGAATALVLHQGGIDSVVPRAP